MDQIRWGIIGCGDVTEHKSGPGIQKATGSKLIAVMRRDGAKAADYAKRHNVPTWYDDADGLIADKDVDIVYVATPPSSHDEYCIKAARAGKPVYVEKPMARTAAECQRMIDACDAAGVKLFVAYYRRCLPNFVKVKDLVDTGAIGEVRHVSVELWNRPNPDFGNTPAGWRIDPATSGGGLFVDLASHTLDALDHLLGPIASASGSALNQAKLYDPEDAVTGHFVFESGATGTGSWNFAAGIHRDSVEIVGSRGAIRFATFSAKPVELETSDGVQTFDLPYPPHVQQPLIQTVVDDLLGRATCPSTGRSALRTNAVIDRMLAGWRKIHPLETR